MNTPELETIWAPRMLSVLRIMAALIFFAHGSEKLLGFPVADRVPDAFTLPWIAGVIELLGGALLILGLFTRPAAFVCSGLMAAACFIAHAPQSIYPCFSGGDAAILFCFVFLYLVFAGPDPWSVDAMRDRRSGAAI